MWLLLLSIVCLHKQGALGPSPPLYFQRRHIRLTESMSAVLLIQTHFFKQIDSRHIPIHTYLNLFGIYRKLPSSQWIQCILEHIFISLKPDLYYFLLYYFAWLEICWSSNHIVWPKIQCSHWSSAYFCLFLAFFQCYFKHLKQWVILTFYLSIDYPKVWI